MNQRKQDELTRSLILCACVPFGLLALVLAVEGAGFVMGQLIGALQ